MNSEDWESLRFRCALLTGMITHLHREKKTTDAENDILRKGFTAMTQALVDVEPQGQKHL